MQGLISGIFRRLQGAWNAALETGGVLISDKIKLVLDVQALKA